MKNDDLGERMKKNYEDRTRYSLPRRTYTVIRVDGKAFHTFTKSFLRPFDHGLMNLMDQTAIALCKGIQGAVLAYVQSDEISVILTDFATPNTEAWFDGNVQKMSSISASMATAAFNRILLEKEMFETNCDLSSGQECADFLYDLKTAHFDSRVFTIPDREEVFNYLIWRQQDAVRNSIQMAAQAAYSQTELHGKSCNELQELLFQKGINWNNYSSGEKRGRAIIKEKYTIPAHTLDIHPPVHVPETTRNRWIALTGPDNTETPTFTAYKEFLKYHIPLIGDTNEG